MKKTTTCTYYVSGMHCGSCEVLLNTKIAKLDGVTSVDASLTDSTVDIVYKKGHKPQTEQLNKTFGDLGYTFSATPVGGGKINQLQIVQAAAIIILFIVGYLILEDTQLLSRFTIDDTSTLPAFVVLGIIASLSSCAALVGGVLLAMSRQWNQLYGGKNEGKRALPFVLFNIGRLISFALLGGLLGLIGSFFQLSLQFTAILIIGVSFIMILLGLQMLGVSWAQKIRLGFPSFVSTYAAKEQNFKGKYMPFTMGALTFFLPCGFTLMAQTVALTTGNFITSMLMMLAFALGTLPMLGLLSFSSVKFSKNSALSGTFNLLVGLFILVFGAYNVNSQLNVLGVVSLSDVFARSSSNQTAQTSGLGVELVGEGENQYQQVTMEAREFEYFPKSLKLKAGVPTTLSISNYNVVGCAQAMWLGGLYDEVLYLNTPKAQATFTPQKGTYKISCTMGMVPPVMVRVE